MIIPMTSPDFVPDLQAAFDNYAARQVQAAIADRDQRITVLTGQLAAAQQTIAALQSQLAGGGTLPAAPTGFMIAAQDDFSTGKVNTDLWNVRDNDSSSNELSLRLAANVLCGTDHLTIRAQRQAVGNFQFTSGYLDNIGKASGVVPFGRWLIRARWTDLYGLWPALWLRFTNGAGEIDIMEAIGSWPNIAHTAHQDTNGQQDKTGTTWPFPAGWKPSDWHVYGLERQADGTLIWSIDGTVTKTASPRDKSTKLHQPMSWLTGPTYAGGLNLRVNLQVGGSMPGSVLPGLDPSKILPPGTVGALDIDWIQVLAPAS
jgi:beta-glucanase (GH16 family)